MQITVTTRASTENLIDLATVRRRLLGASDTSQDEELQALIVEVSSAVSGYLGVPLARQGYQLAIRGDGCSRTMLLPRYPIDRDSVTCSINGDAVTDVIVIDSTIGKIYRGYGWTYPVDPFGTPLNVVLAWIGGYVLPDQVQTWASSLTGLTLGSWVRPTSPALSPLLFEVTTEGDAGGAEPTWPTTAGDTIALGGGAEATARDAVELPPLLSGLVFVEIFNRFSHRDRPPGLASQMAGGFQESYFATQTEADLCPQVTAGLDRMRAMVS